jgi:hypothetical protein
MRAARIGTLLLLWAGVAGGLAGAQTADVLYPVEIMVATTSD